ncbi:MAG: hypothetical protein NZT92_10135 [Abditibacteriales bacterium]|nr:hypothetical protein [Abditibacteriales bacterium]MDW8366326.1 hypothetical protein [Abditibacteriales bacterium]
MADTITLARVEELAAQLPPTEQLELVAHICEQLSVLLPAMPLQETTRNGCSNSGWRGQRRY